MSALRLSLFAPPLEPHVFMPWSHREDETRIGCKLCGVPLFAPNEAWRIHDISPAGLSRWARELAGVGI